MVLKGSCSMPQSPHTAQVTNLVAPLAALHAGWHRMAQACLLLQPRAACGYDGGGGGDGGGSSCRMLGSAKPPADRLCSAPPPPAHAC
jgi:hypothetical protein